jgi:hypothetical protein
MKVTVMLHFENRIIRLLYSWMYPVLPGDTNIHEIQILEIFTTAAAFQSKSFAAKLDHEQSFPYLFKLALCMALCRLKKMIIFT